MPIPFLPRARHQYRRLYFVLRWVEDLTSPSKPGSKWKPLLEVRRQQHGDIFPRPPHAEAAASRGAEGPAVPGGCRPGAQPPFCGAGRAARRCRDPLPLSSPASAGPGPTCP